jgi:hypothetical protein
MAGIRLAYTGFTNMEASRMKPQNVTGLLRNSGFQKAALLTYVLVVLAFSAVSRAQQVSIDLPTSFKAQFHNYFGEMRATSEGVNYIVSEKGDVVELKSEQDLSSYRGFMVRIVGKDLRATVGPVYQTVDFSPDDSFEDKLSSAPVIQVFAIEIVR